MGKLVKKVEQAFGHRKGGDAARAAQAAAQATSPGASKQYTGIDPNATKADSRGGGRSLDQIPGLRIPLGVPSTPLGPRRPNAPGRRF